MLWDSKNISHQSDDFYYIQTRFKWLVIWGKSHVPKSSSLIPWLLSSTNSAYFSFIFLPLTSLHPFQIVWSSVKFLEVDIILYKSNIFFYVYMGFSNIIRHESPISRLYIKLNKYGIIKYIPGSKERHVEFPSGQNFALPYMPSISDWSVFNCKPWYELYKKLTWKHVNL